MNECQGENTHIQHIIWTKYTKELSTYASNWNSRKRNREEEATPGAKGKADDVEMLF
jgi:hypothetical protein